MRLISIIICLFSLLLGVACSSSVKKNQSVKKVTARKAKASSWFMSPEQIALERYQRMRNSGMSHNEALLMLRRHNRPQGGVYHGERLNALKSEVHQNLMFYCFDYKKNGQYSSENQCKEYASKVHQKCQIYNFGHYNRGVLGCVKRLLKMR